MIRVIRADIGRIILKKRLYVFLILSLFVAGIIVLTSANAVEFANYSKKTLLYLGVTANSIMVYLAVFSEEFHTGTMQCVIGRGYSRRTIVISKLIDCALMYVWYFLWYLLTFAAVSGLDMLLDEPILISRKMWFQIILYAGFIIIRSCSFMAITMIVLFLSWSVPLGMMVNLLLCVLSSLIMEAAQSNLELPFNDLWVSGLLDTAYSRMIMGGVGWQLFVEIAVYIVLPIAATVMIFNSKEVEL